MFKEGICVLLVICACVNADIPRSCRRHECPSYTLISNNGTFELRRYAPSTWVKTETIVNNGRWRVSRSNLFRRLFKYIRGANYQNRKIAMTAPVLTKYQPGFPMRQNMVVTRYFMLPSSLRSNPPLPTSRNLSLEIWPEREFYVRSFGGFARDQQNLLHYSKLINDIGNHNLYDNNYVITAGYDAPFMFLNRHNEIWLAKK